MEERVVLHEESKFREAADTKADSACIEEQNSSDDMDGNEDIDEGDCDGDSQKPNTSSSASISAAADVSHGGQSLLANTNAATASAGDCTAPTATKRMRIPAKYRNKKPADMPKRPLSAFNCFFRDQRVLIMQARSEGVPPTEEGGGLFESMAKTIAARWKTISPEQLEKYTMLAQEDTMRYRAQMEQYNKKFVEDKSVAAKRRRAENRKRKQMEKAQQKALETNETTSKVSTSLRPAKDFDSFSGQTVSATFLSLAQAGAANYPLSSTRMQPSHYSNYNPADFQMRLLAAHAEGLGRAVPPTPGGQMNDYFRQVNSASALGDARSVHGGQSEPTSEMFSNTTGTSYGNEAMSNQDPLSILQLIQQQQNVRLPTSSTSSDLDNLLAHRLQMQRAGQLQIQPHLAQLDPSYGLLLQLQRQQQQQQHDMVRLSAEANFYQQHQGQGERGGSNWQPFPGNHQSN